MTDVQRERTHRCPWGRERLGCRTRAAVPIVAAAAPTELPLRGTALSRTIGKLVT